MIEYFQISTVIGRFFTAVGAKVAADNEQYSCKSALDINKAWYKIQKTDKTYKLQCYPDPHTLDVSYGYFRSRLDLPADALPEWRKMTFGPSPSGVWPKNDIFQVDSG